MNKHILTKMSLLQAQVCSNGTLKEALSWMRNKNAAGTTANWCESKEDIYKPIQCDDHADRQHYMFEC